MLLLKMMVLLMVLLCVAVECWTDHDKERMNDGCPNVAC